MSAAKSKKHAEPKLRPEQVLSIVYEDDDLLAIDKAAGIPVTPGGGYRERSVVRTLGRMGYAPVFPVGQLDREATGLVLLSRKPEVARRLRASWRSEACERRFIAVAQGDIKGARGQITYSLGPDPKRPRGRRRAVVPRDQGGKPARTGWRLLARGRTMSRLELTMRGGGRTDQLRIHLAKIGHPLVGDERYHETIGEVPLDALLDDEAIVDKHADAPNLPSHQVALHALAVAIDHPMTFARLELETALPHALLGLMPGAWIVDPT